MVETSIERLGRRGDGIATTDEGNVFVPFTLPGEQVEITNTGQRRAIEKIIRPSPDRITPVCTHFGVCGGCQMQHMGEDCYLKWKLALLHDALGAQGITHDTEPIHSFAIPSRRRAVFQAQFTKTGLLFGFAKRLSNTVINIDSCPVLVKEISSRIQDLKDLASLVPKSKKGFRVSVLSCVNGLDININGITFPDDRKLQSLVSMAVDKDFARLSIANETVVERRKPELGLGGIVVHPPPGAFVQAVKAAEIAMAQSVVADLSPCKSVADLYSGIGTFALRLARESEVLAVEEDGSAIEALDAAWRATAGKLKRIRTEKRNLERSPLQARELKKFDGLVFDPPRAGAELQALQIAKSGVPRVAAVSCNPVTLARDLRILVDEGYNIMRIMPVDQFRYTPHLEVVALLRKE